MTWTVLLVEDDDEINARVADVLAARGLRVLRAANGAEAIATCLRAAIKPAVIVLDVMMPAMGGLEFLEVQPTLPLLADVPVILSSGTAVSGPLPPAVVGLLPKPTKIADLIALVHDCCAGYPRVRTTTEMVSLPGEPGAQKKAT